MKFTSSLALMLLSSSLSWGQQGFSGTVGGRSGIRVHMESQVEPPKPELPSIYQMGTGSNHDKFYRYTANTKSHEYFGYEMRVEPASQPGMYRVVFSALAQTAKDLSLPDPPSWTMLPAPTFPAPEIVSASDTIAMELYFNPSTGQKIVDYLRVNRESCDGQISCWKEATAEAAQLLSVKLRQMESKGDAATVAALKESQPAWEKYRDAACANIADESKRLQCELKLSQSRLHDLGEIY